MAVAWVELHRHQEDPLILSMEHHIHQLLNFQKSLPLVLDLLHTLALLSIASFYGGCDYILLVIFMERLTNHDSTR